MLLPVPGEPKLSLPWSKRLWGNLLVAGGSPVPCKGDSHSTFLPTLPGGSRSCCSGHAVMAVMLLWSSSAAARALPEDFTIQTSVFCRLPRALPGMLAYERPPPFVLCGWQCDLPGQAASPLCTFLMACHLARPSMQGPGVFIMCL